MPESRTCRARAYEVAGEAKLNNEGPVYVTKPFLPPLDEFLPFLEEIWSTKILTNAGPFHQRLETELARFLGVEHLALVSNGTLGLVVALQALHITGEVITTPFSFAATAHSLIWNNLSPVFVDIEPNTLNLDPAKIEAAITPDTSAIMPVHCYGTPCRTDEIQRIADVYGLKVIYDAAHAFNVRVDDRSILAAGDLSVLSFHATKVFNTFEGGAIVCPDAKAKQRIDYLKNFGIADEVTVTAPGINAKMNEFQAALGLLQLKYADTAIEQRHTIANRCERGGRYVRVRVASRLCAGLPTPGSGGVVAGLVGRRLALGIQTRDGPEQVTCRLEDEVAARRVGHREREDVTARAELWVLGGRVRSVNQVRVIDEAGRAPTGEAEQHGALRRVRLDGGRRRRLSDAEMALDAQVLLRIRRRDRVAQLARVRRPMWIVAGGAGGRWLIVGGIRLLFVVGVDAPFCERSARLVAAGTRGVRCAPHVEVRVP